MARMPSILFSIVALTCTLGMSQDNRPGKQVDEDGAVMKPGLVAHYFKDPTEWEGHWKAGTKPIVKAESWTFQDYKYTRKEPLVNHLFVRRGWFSVRWVGYLRVAAPKGGKDLTGDGTHFDFTLELWMDDGARLFLDGKELVDDWRPCAETAPDAHRKVEVGLSAGFHRIVIEYFQGESLRNSDHDPAKFFWSSKALKIKRKIVPASQFFHTADDLEDYEPSQGLSPEDLAELDGGQRPSIDFNGVTVGDGSKDDEPDPLDETVSGNSNAKEPENRKERPKPSKVTTRKGSSESKDLHAKLLANWKKAKAIADDPRNENTLAGMKAKRKLNKIRKSKSFAIIQKQVAEEQAQRMLRSLKNFELNGMSGKANQIKKILLGRYGATNAAKSLQK